MDQLLPDSQDATRSQTFQGVSALACAAVASPAPAAVAEAMTAPIARRPATDGRAILCRGVYGKVVSFPDERVRGRHPTRASGSPASRPASGPPAVHAAGGSTF
ncbi:hypothetical protein GCM10027572_14240 [Flexivirga lutea]